jgi:O-acetylhomoserine/O-acetylserine sulfhydrylase-like pyridoxal-dependent enzyme
MGNNKIKFETLQVHAGNPADKETLSKTVPSQLSSVEQKNHPALRKGGKMITIEELS